MSPRVVVERTDGVVSAVGLRVEGFLLRCALPPEGAARRQLAVELRYLVAYLRHAGVVVEHAEALETLA